VLDHGPFRDRHSRWHGGTVHLWLRRRRPRATRTVERGSLGSSRTLARRFRV